MADLITRVYHRMPPFARSVGASLRGYYLRSWRYGAETETLVAEAIEREKWSREKWLAWQQERLSLLLHRAATRVPYYRRQWSERRRRGDRASWEYLENWPVLEKESIRQEPGAFVADGLDTRRMFHVHTSGTTGKPLDIWYSRPTARAWYALFEARCRRWYGVSRHDRWAILGGQLVTPAGSRRPPFWVWNAALNQLYMSSYHLAPDLIEHYLDALRRYRIRYVLGYTSSLYELAQEALRLGRRDLKMAVALTNAEPLFDYQREEIEAAFQCPVYETYGMAEIAAAASECESRSLHLWPDVSHIEVVRDDEPVSSGSSGELIATGLLNIDMPLIRYRVGDRIRLMGADETCDCGRTLPLLASIEGRLDDVLYTSDGRRIGRLDPVFKANLPVREAQIIQESLASVRVLYVPAAGFTAAAGRSIIERLRSRMGAIAVTLEEVDKLPRGANGKFRAVICNIPPEDLPAR
ncbi:MAG TPA: AMP-binding protein [Blastocatellia bacterium]|nr:AMP-binding protein [Blastocatellia bacterium]